MMREMTPALILLLLLFLEAVDKTRTLPGDRKWFDTTTKEAAAESHQEALTDDGSGSHWEKPLDDRLSKVDEGWHLMQRFYQLYSTTAQVDLVFVLDRSGSVPLKGWHSVIEFVKVGASRCSV